MFLGPAGLIRKLPEGYDDQLMHHPELAPSPETSREKVREIFGVEPCDPAFESEQVHGRVTAAETSSSRMDKTFDMEEILQWKSVHHQGHVHSFQDTIHYGPLQTLDLWRNVCDIIAGRTSSNIALQNSKLLIYFGRDDSIIVGEETTEDIIKLLPPAHLQYWIPIKKTQVPVPKL